MKSSQQNFYQNVSKHQIKIVISISRKHIAYLKINKFKYYLSNILRLTFHFSLWQTWLHPSEMASISLRAYLANLQRPFFKVSYSRHFDPKRGDNCNHWCRIRASRTRHSGPCWQPRTILLDILKRDVYRNCNFWIYMTSKIGPLTDLKWNNSNVLVIYFKDLSFTNLLIKTD